MKVLELGVETSLTKIHEEQHTGRMQDIKQAQHQQ
jgi:hypothetical protein